MIVGFDPMRGFCPPPHVLSFQISSPTPEAYENLLFILQNGSKPAPSQISGYSHRIHFHTFI